MLPSFPNSTLQIGIGHGSLVLCAKFETDPMTEICVTHAQDFARVEILDKYLNTLRPEQNGLHLADDIFKCILTHWYLGDATVILS